MQDCVGVIQVVCVTSYMCVHLYHVAPLSHPTVTDDAIRSQLPIKTESCPFKKSDQLSAFTVVHPKEAFTRTLTLK